MSLLSIVPWLALICALLFLLWVDLKLFARNREPTLSEAIYWSLGWFAMSLLVAIPLLFLSDAKTAVNYVTVYLIERSLSLDNLFVFMVIFAYFGVPQSHRARLLFWGIVAALALRAVTILTLVELIDQLKPLIYALAAGLVYLAYRMFAGMGENVDPGNNLIVRGVRRLYPVASDHRGAEWFVTENARTHVTPFALAFAAIVFTDIIFAIDSIPAAIAITRDPLTIWMGNVFGLLGLRALFVLVEILTARFSYLDQSIAVVLVFVAAKLVLETAGVMHIPSYASLAGVLAILGAGMVASIIVKRGAARRA